MWPQVPLLLSEAKHGELYLNCRRGARLYGHLMWKMSLFSLCQRDCTAGCYTWGPALAPVVLITVRFNGKRIQGLDKTWLEPACAQSSAIVLNTEQKSVLVEFTLRREIDWKLWTCVCELQWSEQETSPGQTELNTDINSTVCVCPFSSIMTVVSEDESWTGQGCFHAWMDVWAPWQVEDSQMCVFVWCCACVFTCTRLYYFVLPFYWLQTSAAAWLNPFLHDKWLSKFLKKCQKLCCTKANVFIWILYSGLSIENDIKP